jgi:hypothetical protein
MWTRSDGAMDWSSAPAVSIFLLVFIRKEAMDLGPFWAIKGALWRLNSVHKLLKRLNVLTLGHNSFVRF